MDSFRDKSASFWGKLDSFGDKSASFWGKLDSFVGKSASFKENLLHLIINLLYLRLHFRMSASPR